MPLIQREIRRRGLFGHLFKWSFVLFNLAMAAWLLSYWMTTGDLLAGARSDAERAGGAIGATLGTGMIMFVWAAGAVVLGMLALLTRGRRVLITEDAK